MNQSAAILSRQNFSLAVKLAESSDEIDQAMRLRYKVFVEEAKNLHLYNESGMEQDEYDQYCDHLIVKDQGLDQVVGTYRLLPGERTVGIGFYSETEFDLSGFQTNRWHTLELGRSCVSPDYRAGNALKLLWEGIACYLNSHPYKYMIGCASLHMKSIGELNQIYGMLKAKGVISYRYGVRPHETHRIQGLGPVDTGFDEKEIFRRLPPLMKGYQWLGAEIGGDPAYDRVFDTTDFFIVLETGRVTRRYQRHFLGR